ncbi:MAG: thermonuclease family protein [Magnetococcales bacterium]|nr:thermonuclease family protein [Magnetococcales bacterium]
MVKFQSVFLKLLNLLLVLLVLVYPQTTLAYGEWRGQVVWVQDGDSLIIKKGSKNIRVRLQGIDAPEKGQPFAQKAKYAAIKMAKNRNVRVMVKERDKYGRTVAKVILPDGRNLSYTMVEKGLAWRHVRYGKDPHLKTLETKARKKGVGIWADKKPTPPWVWKRQHKKQKNKQCKVKGKE